MKKMSLLIIFVLIFSGCSNLPAKSEVPPEPQLTPLTFFDGKGQFIIYYPYDYPLPFLTYLTPETAVQKQICEKQGCEHIDFTCPSSGKKHCRLLGYYNNKLIFRDYASDNAFIDNNYATTTIAVSDTNGENYKVIGSVPYSFDLPDFNIYDDKLVFSTQNKGERFFRSVNLETGDIRQINAQPILKADNYLGTFKDYYFYFSINYDATDRITYEITKINIANGEASTLCTIDQFIDPTVFTTTNYSFCYYNGKIYSLHTKTQKGTDILSEIDCLTGESVVIDDNISCASPNGQHLDSTVLKGNILIRATENAVFWPLDEPKVFAYNISKKTKSGITLSLKDPNTNYEQQLYINAVIGDYILTDYKYTITDDETIIDGNGKFVDTLSNTFVPAIISIDDYLNSVASFKEVVLVYL